MGINNGLVFSSNPSSFVGPASNGVSGQIMGTTGTTLAPILQWQNPPGSSIAVTPWVGDSGILIPQGWGGVTNSSFFWRRDHDNIHIRGSFMSGNPGASFMILGLGESFNMDPAKMSPSGFTNTFRVGIGNRLGGSNGSVFAASDGFVAFYDGGATNSIFVSSTEGTVAGQYNKENGSANFAAGNVFSFEVYAPISGWNVT